MAENEKENGGGRGPLIALVVVVLLFVIGWFLTRELYNSEQLEDCILSGRTNCAPIHTPAG